MLESTKEGLTGLPEGSDIGLGPGGRAFEPHYSDQTPSEIVDFRGGFLFLAYCGAAPCRSDRHARRGKTASNLHLTFCQNRL